jgi:hypothetical protein
MTTNNIHDQARQAGVAEPAGINERGEPVFRKFGKLLTSAELLADAEKRHAAGALADELDRMEAYSGRELMEKANDDLRARGVDPADASAEQLLDALDRAAS